MAPATATRLIRVERGGFGCWPSSEVVVRLGGVEKRFVVDRMVLCGVGVV